MKATVTKYFKITFSMTAVCQPQSLLEVEFDENFVDYQLRCMWITIVYAAKQQQYQEPKVTQNRSEY